ncbi:hypothetical protein JG687_00017685, partial [Phytophthora cactorum]
YTDSQAETTVNTAAYCPAARSSTDGGGAGYRWEGVPGVGATDAGGGCDRVRGRGQSDENAEAVFVQ